MFKRTIQTVSYLPHFISLVVICGLIKEFTQSTGLVSTLLAFFGVPQETMLLDPERFRAVYVISDLWQTIGWNSIIIWRRFPAWTRRCTTRPQWMAPDGSAVCSM